MKWGNKMSRFFIMKFLKEGILRGSYMWLFIGVFTTFLKIISIVGLIEKKRKYFTS